MGGGGREGNIDDVRAEIHYKGTISASFWEVIVGWGSIIAPPRFAFFVCFLCLLSLFAFFVCFLCLLSLFAFFDRSRVYM